MKNIKYIVTIVIAIIASGAIFMGVRHMIQKPCPVESVVVQYATKLGGSGACHNGICPD